MAWFILGRKWLLAATRVPLGPCRPAFADMREGGLGGWLWLGLGVVRWSFVAHRGAGGAQSEGLPQSKSFFFHHGGLLCRGQSLTVAAQQRRFRVRDLRGDRPLMLEI